MGKFDLHVFLRVTGAVTSLVYWLKDVDIYQYLPQVFYYFSLYFVIVPVHVQCKQISKEFPHSLSLLSLKTICPTLWDITKHISIWHYMSQYGFMTLYTTCLTRLWFNEHTCTCMIRLVWNFKYKVGWILPTVKVDYKHKTCLQYSDKYCACMCRPWATCSYGIACMSLVT